MRSALLLLAISLSGCIRTPWHAQRDYAQTLEPSPLLVGVVPPALEKIRVRVRVAEARRALTGWKSTFEFAVDTANGVLGAAAGVELEVVDYEPWPDAPGPRDATATHLEALMRFDAGSDVDLVIGLTDPMTLFVESIDVLGMATRPGRHIVLRGMASVVERDVLKEQLGLLSGDAVDRLLRHRRRHREAVVLLHEVGHCVGAGHIEGEGSIMAANYHLGAERFDDGTVRQLATLSAAETHEEAPSRVDRDPATLARSAGQAATVAQLVETHRLEEAVRVSADLPEPERCALERRVARVESRLPTRDLPEAQRPEAREALAAVIEDSREALASRQPRLQTLESRYPRSTAALVGRCFVEFEHGGRSSACAKAVRRDPRAAIAQLLHGAMLAMKHAPSAATVVETALRLDPELEFGWRLLAGVRGGPSPQQIEALREELLAPAGPCPKSAH